MKQNREKISLTVLFIIQTRNFPPKTKKSLPKMNKQNSTPTSDLSFLPTLYGHNARKNPSSLLIPRSGFKF